MINLITNNLIIKIIRKSGHFLDFAAFRQKILTRDQVGKDPVNYHITKQPSDVTLNTLFLNMFFQRARQLITLLSLAISILYFVLPSFSELTNWIAVVVVTTIHVILIDLECSKAHYLYKQIVLNSSPPLPYSRKIHLILTRYDIITQSGKQDTFFELGECSQLIDLFPCRNKQNRVWRHTILLLDNPAQSFNILVNTQ